MVSLNLAESVLAEPPRRSMSQRLKSWLRRVLPLSWRKRLAVGIARQKWLPQRDWFAVELIRDMALVDTAEYHRFLWGHHLGYARTYEIEERFGEERIHPSRMILFDELHGVLNGRSKTIKSVLEVGCSMGYNLRYLEERVYPWAKIVDGIDIDGYAIQSGAGHLAQLGSRIRLQQADMLQLPSVFSGIRYDLIICAGVLMYVTEEEAQRAVTTMLERSNGTVALAGLAHPDRDNATLTYSVPRETDQSFIHNLDRMVERGGGRVIARRWDGARQIKGNSIYFVFAEPGLSPGLKSPAHGE